MPSQAVLSAISSHGGNSSPFLPRRILGVWQKLLFCSISVLSVQDVSVTADTTFSKTLRVSHVRPGGPHHVQAPPQVFAGQAIYSSSAEMAKWISQSHISSLQQKAVQAHPRTSLSACFLHTDSSKVGIFCSLEVPMSKSSVTEYHSEV